MHISATHVKPREDLTEEDKILPKTWAMKKKASGRKKAIINACGYAQKKGEDYEENGTAAPVVNEITLRIVLALMLIARMAGNVYDIKGAFLHGQFINERRIHIDVPQRWEKHYPGNVLLELLAPIYGLKQSEFAFFTEMLRIMKSMHHKRSKADPCLFYYWGMF